MLLAYSTVFGLPDLPDDIGFLQVEGQQLAAVVGGWFGAFFWFIRAFALLSAAPGIADCTSRLAADVLKTSYLPRVSESRLQFGLVWGLVLIGCGILLVGFDQRLVLIVISASVGGTMMFLYSALLVALSRRVLPQQIRIKAGGIAVLVWSFLLFGTLAALTVISQGRQLFGG